MAEDDEDIEDGEENAGDGGQVAPKPRTKCAAGTPGAVTANQTLRQWLPGKTLIEELLAAEEADRLQAPSVDGGAHVMATYQMPVTATWGEITLELKSRTLEEAFAYENLAWCQKQENRDVGLRWAKSADMTLEELAAKIHKRVKGEAFKKTNFALGLLASTDGGWVVPTYIQDGLNWLALHVAIGDEAPEEKPADADGQSEVAEPAQ